MAEIERHKILEMQNAAVALQTLVSEWADTSGVPEVEWDKIKVLEFQDILRSRESLLARLKGRTCTSCPNFSTHVCSVEA